MARRGRRRIHPFGRTTRVLGSEPVEQYSVGDLPGEAAHPGTERGNEQRRRKVRSQLSDSFADALQRSRARATHAQEKTIERQRAGPYARGDAVRSAGVQWDHADPGLDAPRLPSRVRKRSQPIDRTRIVHPKRAVPERFRFSGRGANDLGCRIGGHREAS